MSERFRKGERVKTSAEALRTNVFDEVQYGTVAANQTGQNESVRIQRDGYKSKESYASDLWERVDKIAFTRPETLQMWAFKNGADADHQFSFGVHWTEQDAIKNAEYQLNESWEDLTRKYDMSVVPVLVTITDARIRKNL